MKKVLFICLGNICRSPTAEAVMQNFVITKGLSDQIFCDSAGTSGYHEGELADSRMRKHALKRGHNLLSRSRQLNYPDDFREFDYLVVMDERNKRDVEYLDAKQLYRNKIYSMVSFCKNIQADEVPDPYFGGEQGFERVIDILEDSCAGLLCKIEADLAK